MTPLLDRDAPAGLLRLGIVLGTTEQACTVVTDSQRAVIAYATAFPGPRTDRVSPGHLVAIATTDEPGETVVWRWYDAVVLDSGDASINLWEPAHGSVLATPRDPRRVYRSGGRAYRSAGLPGAEWWVAGPVVDRAEDADVELGEVEQFLIRHGVRVDHGQEA